LIRTTKCIDLYAQNPVSMYVLIEHVQTFAKKIIVFPLTSSRTVTCRETDISSDRRSEANELIFENASFNTSELLKYKQRFLRRVTQQ
jgi:hypothetical protein